MSSLHGPKGHWDCSVAGKLGQRVPRVAQTVNNLIWSMTKGNLGLCPNVKFKYRPIPRVALVNMERFLMLSLKED